MSQRFIGRVGDLKKNPLWVEACVLAEYFYSILHEFPEEEKWDTERKLRTGANDIMYYLAQGIANGLPTSAEYDWANARKSVSAVLTLYRFAGRQKMIKLDPEIMLRLEKLFEQIDSEAANALEQTRQFNAAELERWQHKYELSKKMERGAQT